MKTMIIYPSDYFDIKKVEPDYENEYNIASQFPEFQIVFLNYDEFISSKVLRIYPNNINGKLSIYRGWMMKPEDYELFYKEMQKFGVQLINSPNEYEKCHMFPNVYEEIAPYTPKTMCFGNIDEIDFDLVNNTFETFMVKDYVKSVKGEAFPQYFKTIVKSEEMKFYLNKFMELRGGLFTGGLIFKEFVNLKKYNGKTNEYRCFYLNHEVVCVSNNSNLNKNSRIVPMSFVSKFRNLGSNFYTIDFGELESGEWIIIETGDGQVSGLSPSQFVLGFYSRIAEIVSR